MQLLTCAKPHSAPIGAKASPSLRSSSPRLPQRPTTAQRRAVVARIIGEKEDKITTKELEDQTAFWTSKTENKDQNPAKDPLAIVGILAIIAPFVIVLLGVQQGWLDTSHYSR